VKASVLGPARREPAPWPSATRGTVGVRRLWSDVLDERCSDEQAAPARGDAASASGPWTVAALRLIEENRGVVARVLAEEMELPKLDFKARVRKLKALGLTVSLPVGYELSELGQTYLDSLRA
jgi:hypothetical protein